MSFSQQGRYQGNRSNRSFKPKLSHINPSRYISHARPAQVQDQPVIEHAFSDFGFHPELMANILRHGYTIPTLIQDKAIPPMMLGSDLVGIADTGTGKTAAFLLPLIHKIGLNPQEGVLIIVPTRELATQIGDEWLQLAAGIDLSMVRCVGGVPIEPQIRNLRRNPHFVIGTPGRLKDLVNRGALNPSMFTNIVLDEVDRMLDIGFVKDINFLVDLLPAKRQSYFFSATMTREADEIMKKFLTNPVMITMKSGNSHAQIEQDVIRVEQGRDKVQVLCDLLYKPEFERVIVFGRTKHGINKLEQVLSERGLKVRAIHGNKTQGARQRSLNDFKQGYANVLLATDVAARGIDIDGVTHVINFDEPNNYEDYTHRIGRTGRAGKMGKALTFIS